MIWKWLGLGKGRANRDIESELTEDQKALIHSHALPAIRLQAGGNGFSRLGGLPDLPDGLKWPRDEAGVPLAFLTQIDLSALPDLARDIGLPEAGILWFFYDQFQRAWGNDPKDKPKWRVLYSDQSVSSCNERWAPDGLKISYPSVPLSFSVIDTFLGAYSLLDNGVDCAVERLELYLDHVSPDIDSRHIMGGYCSAFQDPDMPLHCQLVSNGIHLRGPKDYTSLEASALAAGATDWRLLLQLGSEDKAKMNWGDGGMLYFWIREDDLKAARFDKVWMVLQCG